MREVGEDGFPGIFPQRVGNTDVGVAQERSMHASAGGYKGIRTVEYENNDGTITTLRTRLGWPVFETTERKRGGGTPRYLRCRMMSDLYPRGADVLYSAGYTTQNGNYNWPLYPTSKELLSPGKPYLGVRAPELYSDSPGPQTWYDNRDPGVREFDDTLSWSSMIQPAPMSTYFVRPDLLELFYQNTLGNSKDDTGYLPNGSSYARDIGERIPGQGNETWQNRFTRYEGSLVSLYKNGQYTGVTSLIVAACAIVTDSVVTYRLLTTAYNWPVNGNPPLWVSDYDDTGAFISNVSVTYPVGIGKALFIGVFSWNRSGTQCCVAMNNNRVLLIEDDGSASIDTIPYVNKTTVTGTYIGNFPPVGEFGTADETRRTEAVSDFYWLIDSGYYGDDLRYIVRHDNTKNNYQEVTVGNYYNAFSDPPNPTITAWASGASRQDNHVVSLVSSNMFIQQTSEVLATISATTCEDIIYWEDDQSNPSLANLVVSSSEHIVPTRYGAMIEWADFQQNVFFIREMRANEADQSFSSTIWTNGETVRLINWTSVNRGQNYVLPSYYVPSSSNFVTVYEPAINMDSCRLLVIYNIQSFSAGISRDGLVLVISRLFSLGFPTTFPDISVFKAKNEVAFRVGNSWNIEELKLPTYAGTVKWIGEPLISEF